MVSREQAVCIVVRVGVWASDSLGLNSSSTLSVYTLEVISLLLSLSFLICQIPREAPYPSPPVHGVSLFLLSPSHDAMLQERSSRSSLAAGRDTCTEVH